MIEQLDLLAVPSVRTDTSWAAGQSIRPHRSRLATDVLEAISGAVDGLTCDEVEERLGMRHQTASARVRELWQLGRIDDSGERRLTRSGRRAIVWRGL